MLQGIDNSNVMSEIPLNEDSGTIGPVVNLKRFNTFYRVELRYGRNQLLFTNLKNGHDGIIAAGKNDGRISRTINQGVIQQNPIGTATEFSP